MPHITTIDFMRIRPNHGSQNTAFEELCCQLAGLEQPLGTVLHRKGPGGDGGVECYVVGLSGDETGWQAKYFFEFGQSQVTQLDNSLNQALLKHPRLTCYIVCLPINLRDPRIANRSSEQNRWNDWVDRAHGNAHAAGRQLEIVLWDESALIERLGRDNPLYSGRRAFWFDVVTLTPDWFAAKFRQAREALGRRYTPETDVDLPIRRTMLAFARDPSLEREVERWADKGDELRHSACQAFDRLKDAVPNGAELGANLATSMTNLTRALRASPLTPETNVPVEDWRNLVNAATRAVSECRRALWTNETEQNQDSRNHTSHALSRLEDLLYDLSSDLSDERWQLANQRQLLIYGDAGVGKSHLLADVAARHIEQGFPVVLTLGSWFVDGDPWHQLLTVLDLAGRSAAEFLGALDAAAESRGTRALILVDAINERHGIAVWRERLAAFLAGMRPFPRIAVAVSCRSTYVRHIVDDILDSARLPRIEHVGFAGRATEATRFYLDQRGIVRMAIPNLAPEFENPLFLRTCCDLLERTGQRELPRGLTGVSTIFQFYFQAVSSAVTIRLGLDARYRIVERGLTALTDAIVVGERGYIPIAHAITVLEAIHPSHGRQDASLLVHFESEGVISVEIVGDGSELDSEQVRFTFERLSDYRIASRLLDQHLNAADSIASFAPGTLLRDLVTGVGSYERAGIIEALSVQVPERIDQELIDLVDDDNAQWDLWEAFESSLLWRDQEKFTARTLALLEQLSSIRGDNRTLSTLIAIATEPRNRFNALFLHERLLVKPMPHRDAEWSIVIADLAEQDGNPINTLIAWTLANGLYAIEEGRAELTALVLTWLLTTNHRAMRDSATKALAALLTPRRALAARLITRFAEIDDAYLLDRLIAAAYGAAMQLHENDGLEELARVTFEAVFARDPIPVNALIRDHARGILELAYYRGVLPSDIEIARARPPYGPGIPIDAVSDETVETYVQEYGSGSFRDAITGSAIEDGDFARYEIDSLAGHWTRLPISDAGRSAEEIYYEWQKHTIGTSPMRRQALQALITASQGRYEARPRWSLGASGLDVESIRQSSEREIADAEFKSATEALTSLFTPEEIKAYLVRAAGFLDGSMWSDREYVYRPTYSGSISRRWVGWRAHELGWSPALFGKYERNLHEGGRMEHRIERVGKKYQWIALQELAARLGDLAAFERDRGNGVLGQYEGPWDIGLRDMDPSLLVMKTNYLGGSTQNATWWVPFSVPWRRVDPPARRQWVQDDERDIPDGPMMIDVTDPATSTRWLVLENSVASRQWAVRSGERNFEREVWYKICCVLTSRDHADQLQRSLDRNESRRDRLPEIEMPRGAYVGEYMWHPSYSETDGWFEASEYGASVPCQPTVTEHYVERSGHDYSIEDSFNLHLPAPSLIQGLGLRLSNGRELSYADAQGRTLFFDPSVRQPGFSAGLVDFDSFTAFLDRKGLEALWIFTGEKNAYGGGLGRAGFGGRLEYWAIYRLVNGQIQGVLRKRRREPSQEQFDAFLGETSGSDL